MKRKFRIGSRIKYINKEPWRHYPKESSLIAVKRLLAVLSDNEDLTLPKRLVELITDDIYGTLVRQLNDRGNWIALPDCCELCNNGDGYWHINTKADYWECVGYLEIEEMLVHNERDICNEGKRLYELQNCSFFRKIFRLITKGRLC